MAEEVKRELIKFMAEPEIRMALKLRAAFEDSNITAVIVNGLRAYLKEEIAELRRRGLTKEPAVEEPKKTGKRKSQG